MMSRRNYFESAVIRAFAEPICQRIKRKVIADLQQITNGLQSGVDSGLKNAWDELCVQQQSCESIFWDLYVQTVRGSVVAYVEQLHEHERKALWLQTPQGQDWCWEEEEERDPVPYISTDEIASYLMQEYIFHEAGRWSNARIRKYLDH